MSLVALLKCNSYDQKKVRNAIEKGLDFLGGIKKFFSENDKILLKPNLLAAVPPERAITTHPEIFRAIAEILKENNFYVGFGDGPGVISFKNAKSKCGLDKIAKELNIEEADFHNIVVRKNSQGIQNKNFEVFKALIDFDKVISLPKFKTHDLTRITCAVKNQYGVISFRQKREFHAVMQKTDRFAKMLLDINKFVSPEIYIVDAVHAMDGNGPVNGNPYPLNLIAISADPVALDATMCRIINLDPYLVETIKYGEKFGFGTADPKKIKIVGNSVEEFITKDFKVNRMPFPDDLKTGNRNLFTNILSKIPVVNKENCIKCGDCISACPVEPKAITLNKNDIAPTIDYKICIHCYCCSETCIHSAITVKQKGIGRLIFH